MIADATVGLSSVVVDGDDLYWLESRPNEEGRVVLVHQRGETVHDMTPSDYSVRSRVHEYGGGAVTVRDGTIYFVNLRDQHVYTQHEGELPNPLAEVDDDRFADIEVDRERDRIICVRERHTANGVENALVALPMDGGEIEVLDGAHDFVSNPRLSPDGTRLCWTSWDLPDMPWDSATLWVADVDGGGRLSQPQRVAGGGTQSVFQPEWHPDGRLIFVCDPSSGQTRVVKRASDIALPSEDLSEPEPIAFPTTGGATAHAFYYPPRNSAWEGPAGERPPLVVRGHGGPTGASSPSLSIAIQFWTTRGFGVLDVNYRGSTGFGRAYREALYGGWGVTDVDDMVAGAEFLVARGDADADRLAIRGGSAGGYTTLAALAFRDTFSVGASLYGIGDLMTLARDTHKFESRYLDRLIGPLPEAEAVYRERSPVNHVDQLDCPVIFLQGSEDKVVPPNQAEDMVAALDAKGIPVAYVLFEGEGHGFRGAANVRRALEAELAFYGRIMGFEPADDLPELEIRNLG
ncbi:MAG: S9 family peptidase [Alphaproteobacteria bacterium]|nr:S9 family peptidase [Alphaproteobacteria bacterium]